MRAPTSNDVEQVNKALAELRDGTAAKQTDMSPEEAEFFEVAFTAALIGLQPIPMLLYCPKCEAQHVDKATEDWANPPHKSHLCGTCAHVWRPSDVPTVGVEKIETKGQRDGSPHPLTFTRQAHDD